MTVRQDYYYPNLEKSLIGIVDLCVASIFKGGAKVYNGKKDFIVKAIQNQIDYEAKKNKDLAVEINKRKNIVVVENTAKSTRIGSEGGNRIHVTK